MTHWRKLHTGSHAASAEPGGEIVVLVSPGLTGRWIAWRSGAVVADGADLEGVKAAVEELMPAGKQGELF